MRTEISKAYLEFARKVIEGGRATVSNACASPHAGGSAYKGKQAATVTSDCAVESTDGGAPAATASDDDGGGDGDPDSDRRKLHGKSKPSRIAQLQRPSENRVLRMPILRDKVGLSRSTIYELISKCEFPASIPLGPRAVGWLESDIDAWLEGRVNASKAA
jgi:prophage regulatory protein